jgi:hypothetical protein
MLQEEKPKFLYIKLFPKRLRFSIFSFSTITTTTTTTAAATTTTATTRRSSYIG